MKVLDAACLMLLLVACSPPGRLGGDGPEVLLEVEPDPVSAGDRVGLVLVNRSSGPVGYNLCTSQLERQGGGVWEPVPSNRICTMEIRMLPPGEEARYPLDLPPDLPPGEYRFGTTVEWLETRERGPLRSEPFRVVG